MNIVIKKRVVLDFLGEEYKDSYIVVKAIGIGEYDSLKGTVKEEVVNRFLEGEIKQDSGMIKLEASNLDDLPGEVFVKVFEAMTGVDPKANGQLTNQSSMEAPPLPN